MVELDPVADGRVARRARAPRPRPRRPARRGATTCGVASTGTSPVPCASAVSASVTTWRHGSGETGVERHRRTIRNPRPTAPLGGCPCSRPQSSKPPCTAPSRGGGDFAEVFVEDRPCVERPLRRRQGRGAALRPRPGRRHPGRARRHHRLRPHRRPLRRGPRRRGRARRPPRPGAAAAGTRGRAADPPATAPAAARRRDRCPETVAKARKVELLRTRRRRGRAAESDAISQVTVDTPTRRRRILVANSDGLLADDDQVRTRFVVQCVATGDTGHADRHARRPGRTIGLRALRRAPARGDRAHRRGARASASCSTPCPRRRGKLPVVLRARRRRRAVPRGVRPRARGRPHRQGRVGVPRARSASSVASPLRHARRRRHATPASGARSRSTTRARPRSATC